MSIDNTKLLKRHMCVHMYVAWHVHCSIHSSLLLTHILSLIWCFSQSNLSFPLTCLIKALVTPSNQRRFVISCSRCFSISCQQYDNESFPSTVTIMNPPVPVGPEQTADAITPLIAPFQTFIHFFFFMDFSFFLFCVDCYLDLFLHFWH